jgi:hypothetical protein
LKDRLEGFKASVSQNHEIICKRLLVERGRADLPYRAHAQVRAIFADFCPALTERG